MIELECVEISGAPTPRGLQYGEIARDRIRAGLTYYEHVFGAEQGLSWAAVSSRAERWADVIRRTTGDLWLELEAIARAAGVPVLDLVVLNARSEIMMAVGPGDSDPTTATISGSADGECTSYAVLADATSDGHVYCGQNWDYRLAAQVIALRVVQPGKPSFISILEAGQLGRQGANSAGIAVNSNALDGHYAQPPVRLPGTVLRRLMLESPTLTEVLELPFVHGCEVPLNLLISSRDSFAIDLEITPAGATWVYPSDGVLAHGNHFLSGVPVGQLGAYRPKYVDSLYRTRIVQQRLVAASRASDGRETRTVLAQTLADHVGAPEGVCAHYREDVPELRRAATITSSIVDLSTGDFLVAPGNPCEQQYAKLPWGLYDEPR